MLAGVVSATGISRTRPGTTGGRTGCGPGHTSPARPAGAPIPVLRLAALLANWRGEPDIALSHFQRGLQIAPPGAPRVRLRYIASRSYALLGDSTQGPAPRE